MSEVTIPGDVLRACIKAKGFRKGAFAKACKVSPKLISQIIHGHVPISPASAIKFEKFLGVDASIWMNLESAYRLKIEREKEKK